MLYKKTVDNGVNLKVYTPFDFQPITQQCFCLLLTLIY